jgi:hypothetical protein
MYLQFYPKPSCSRTNVGLLLVPDDRGMAAFVGTASGRAGSFRSQRNVVTGYVEPSCGPTGENLVGFLRR